jgi:hypothetical protein
MRRYPWAPTLDLRLEFALDRLGALSALLATAIGVDGSGSRARAI